MFPNQPVGCAMADQHVYSSFYIENKDSLDPRYNTKFGIYSPHCGLDNVLMSFGHDDMSSSLVDGLCIAIRHSSHAESAAACTQVPMHTFWIIKRNLLHLQSATCHVIEVVSGTPSRIPLPSAGEEWVPRSGGRAPHHPLPLLLRPPPGACL